MKTNQLTQRKEHQVQQIQQIQQIQETQNHLDSNQHLEDDEKIRYSESLEDTEDTLVGIATTLFLIFGFPFYVIIGFTALASFLTEKTWSEFGQEITWPAGILLAVAGISILLALAFKTAYRATRRPPNCRNSTLISRQECKKALMHIPDDVQWERSEKSKNAAIYKEKTKWETVLALSGLAVVVCFLA